MSRRVREPAPSTAEDPSERRDPQLLKGVLPMLVLALLSERESYGYELVVRLQDKGLTDIVTGSVYPVLTRLEREGAVTSRLEASSSGPARKYYVPSDRGRSDLARTVRSWQALTRVVDATVPSTLRPTAPSDTSALPNAQENS